MIAALRGTFRGRTKLSKYGNARLRRTFWMAAQVASRQRDNSFRDKLGRYVAGHGDDPDRRRKAMTALTAKMARVAHAVVKTGTQYRPFVERSDARWKDPPEKVWQRGVSFRPLSYARGCGRVTSSSHTGALRCSFR